MSPDLLGVHMSRTSKYSVSAPAALTSVFNAGLYIRLSREDGDKIESESVASQKALLERFVSENDEIGLKEYYIDDGYSGTDFDRPAFQRMMSDAAGKKINCVIVKDLSRFGRNYVESGRYLEHVFPAFKLRFIAVNDGIDSYKNPSTMKNVIVPFKNIINDEYCRDISMKVRSALDIRRRLVIFIGFFAVLVNKTHKNDRNRLVIDDEAAATVRYIFSKFLSGYSIIGVARDLNARGVLSPAGYKASKGLNFRSESGGWTDCTVRRILTNEVYIGNLVQKKNEVISYKIHTAKAVDKQNRIIVKGTHEAIISKQDFDRVQSLLSRDTRTSPNEKEGKLSVFAGFLKCADCGRAMQKRTVRQPYKTYEYYICSTYRKMHSSMCTKHAIRAEVLEEAVLTTLNKYIAIAVDFDRLIEKINRAQKGGVKSKRLSAELAANEREKERSEKILLELYPDFKNGLLSRGQYLALKEKYENAVARSEKEIKRIKAEMQAFLDGVDGGNEFIATFKKYNGLKELSRDILTELVENIYILEGGAVEIHLKCKDAYLSAAEYIEQCKNVNKKRA